MIEFSKMRHRFEIVGDVFPQTLPYVEIPGRPLPPDGLRDRIILDKIKAVGGEPIRPGQKLDLAQSEALYRNVREYFDHTEPLMKTERWMADFVERNGLTYTDHDGKTYVMKDGIRVPASRTEIVLPEDEEDAEEWIIDEDF